MNFTLFVVLLVVGMLLFFGLCITMYVFFHIWKDREEEAYLLSLKEASANRTAMAKVKADQPGESGVPVTKRQDSGVVPVEEPASQQPAKRSPMPEAGEPIQQETSGNDTTRESQKPESAEISMEGCMDTEMEKIKRPETLKGLAQIRIDVH